jgi:hypothetical protein
VISLASYRFRLPLSLSVSAVATALFIALAIGAQTLTNLREDQGRNALSLGHALTGVMLQALRNDDVWLAYSLLRGPEGGGADSIWIVADAGGRIFASNQPRRYRLDQPLSEALPWLPQEGELSSAASPGRVVPVAQDEVRRLLRLPLVVDDNRVGSWSRCCRTPPICRASGRSSSAACWSRRWCWACCCPSAGCGAGGW